MISEREAVQRRFAAHLRDPANCPPPADVDARRMRVYGELVRNAVESFVGSSFPVLKVVLGAELWRTLVGRFLATHACRTPYFLRVAEEFLEFLQGAEAACLALPAFAAELAHYEWVELALDVAEEEVDAPGVDPAGALAEGMPVLSPLAWPLSYAWPVHRIGREFQPEAPGERPTCLVVYRNREDRVKFLEVNEATLRLLALVGEGCRSGRALAAQLATELGQPGIARVEAAALDTLERLRALDIVSGTRAAA